MSASMRSCQPRRRIGREHAVIHPDIPRVANVGYLVGGRLFHPGDALTEPGEPVEVLAAPAGAPWLLLADAVDYLRRVGPRVAVPVHEKVLSEAGIKIHYGRLEDLAGEGTSFRVLDDGKPVETRNVPCVAPPGTKTLGSTAAQVLELELL